MNSADMIPVCADHDFAGEYEDNEEDHNRIQNEMFEGAYSVTLANKPQQVQAAQYVRARQAHVKDLPPLGPSLYLKKS